MLELKNKIKQSLDGLEAYLDTTDLKGYDPYDALNSRILSSLSFNKKLLKIVYTQALKKLPLNLRPLLLIKKDYNPKGLGLFLSGYLKLYSLHNNEKYLKKINHLISILDKIKSKGYSGYCWGYNFDWQSMAGFTPKGTPTIVNTAFIAHGFLDAYELVGEERFLKIARSCCNFILNDLNILRHNDYICFSYTPINRQWVHNANILGAGLLSRVYSITKENELIDYAKKAAKYTVTKQRPDGSWYYAETDYQRWIDCHHTGFVLEGLFNYISYSEDKTYLRNLQKGLEFFENHFFLKDGRPKFFHNRNYPIDIHCSAQAIITLTKLKSLKDDNRLLQKLVCWMIDHMQHKHGYFYYRKGRIFSNKIAYIRWSQAWAFYALTSYYLYLQKLLKREEEIENRCQTVKRY